jgi:hypothetical protein
MNFTIDYTTGAGNAAVYIRQRNFSGKYANFMTSAWDSAESTNTKAFFSEPDPVNAPGFYSVTLVPISGGGWPMEVVEAVTGTILYKGVTKIAAVGNGAGSEFVIGITVAANNGITTAPVPDVTVTLMNSDGSVLLSQKQTDSMGTVQFPANNGTYIVRYRLTGYSFEDGTVIVDNTSPTYACVGTAKVFPAVPVIGMQILMIYANEIDGSWAIGDAVYVTPAPNQQTATSILSTKPLQAVIGINGVAELNGEVGIPVAIGTRITIRVGSYYSKTITTDDNPVKNLMEYI